MSQQYDADRNELVNTPWRNHLAHFRPATTPEWAKGTHFLGCYAMEPLFYRMRHNFHNPENALQELQEQVDDPYIARWHNYTARIVDEIYCSQTRYLTKLTKEEMKICIAINNYIQHMPKHPNYELPNIHPRVAMAAALLIGYWPEQGPPTVQDYQLAALTPFDDINSVEVQREPILGHRSNPFADERRRIPTLGIGVSVWDYYDTYKPILGSKNPAARKQGDLTKTN